MLQSNASPKSRSMFSAWIKLASLFAEHLTALGASVASEFSLFHRQQTRRYVLEFFQLELCHHPIGELSQCSAWLFGDAKQKCARLKSSRIIQREHELPLARLITQDLIWVFIESSSSLHRIFTDSSPNLLRIYSSNLIQIWNHRRIVY